MLSTRTQASGTRYWPALDGIRGLAVLFVVSYHLGLPYSRKGGSIGVTMFFALSGFLITSILLAEADATGSVRLRRFYARRALRLLPALVVLVVAVSVYAGATDRADDTLSAAPAVVGYVANWRLALQGFDALGLFGHLWSLSVEEQFYLLWPVVVLGAVSLAARRGATVVLVASLVGATASLLWRVWLWDSTDPGGSGARVYAGTDTVADQLLLGCGLAALLHLLHARPDGRALARVRAWAAALAPLALLFLMWVVALRPGGETPANARLYLTWGATGFAAAAALVVSNAVLSPAGTLSRMLSVHPLMWLGKISYGLYLWHVPVIEVTRNRLGGAPEGARWVVATAASLAAAAASWRFVEEPFLRRKDALRRAPDSTSDAPVHPTADSAPMG